MAYLNRLQSDVYFGACIFTQERVALVFRKYLEV